MDFRQTVLEEGMHIFQQNGINTLTMEAILVQLEISKGTLQGIASSKEALLDQCVDAWLKRRQDHFTGILQVSSNPLEAIMHLVHANLKDLAGHHPAFLPDLRSSYPACWNKLQEFSNKNLLAYLTGQFTEGISDGLFDSEIDAALVSELLIAQTYAIVETNILNKAKNNARQVFKLAFEYYLRGILTKQGLQIFETIISPAALAKV